MADQNDWTSADETSYEDSMPTQSTHPQDTAPYPQAIPEVEPLPIAPEIQPQEPTYAAYQQEAYNAQYQQAQQAAYDAQYQQDAYNAQYQQGAYNTQYQQGAYDAQYQQGAYNTQYQQTSYSAQYQQYDPGYGAPAPTSNPTAVASLVLGILALLMFWTGYGSIPAFILSIIGVVLGSKARKETPSGVATGGFVCSLIALILSALVLVCVVCALGAIGTVGLAGALVL